METTVVWWVLFLSNGHFPDEPALGVGKPHRSEEECVKKEMLKLGRLAEGTLAVCLPIDYLENVQWL